MAAVTSELTWLESLLVDLGVKLTSPSTLFCDSQAAIHIPKNLVFHERTKHIEVDCHFVREKVQSEELKLEHVPASGQVADILTKALPRKLYYHFLFMLGAYDLYVPACGGVIISLSLLLYITLFCILYMKKDLQGEFTLRAFLNGRLDLTQAENVGKLISSKSLAAAEAALAGIQACQRSLLICLRLSLGSHLHSVEVPNGGRWRRPTQEFIPRGVLPLGGFSALVKALRMQCIELLAEIEARLDFDDELPPLDLDILVGRLTAMCQDVQEALETSDYDKLLQSGLQIQEYAELLKEVLY
ncbi:hypothetical protein KSP40_PGU012734 [Platanthera guangdongensis]|uniref:MnmE helical domain-containing protein n=1 Tax=Platanthera guangdongensis TaxID=2320717 RepID=A0ABR2LQX0_9ASPA